MTEVQLRELELRLQAGELLRPEEYGRVLELIAEVRAHREGAQLHLWGKLIDVTVPTRSLPTIDELTGSDPDFTGERRTEEYLQDIRGGSIPTIWQAEE